MPTPIYPSWNDKEFDLLKKMTENTALIADYEIGDVASVAGTANQVLVNGGTAAATGNITLSLPSLISGISRISTTGTTTGVTDLLINPTTKASGNLIDAQVNSVSKFSVTSAGAGTFGGNLTVSGDVLLPTNSAYRLNGKIALLYNGSNLYIEPNNDLGNIVIGASAQTTYGFTVGGNLTVNSTTDANSSPSGSIYTAGGLAVGTNKKFMAGGTGGYWGSASAGNQESLLIRCAGFGYGPTSYAAVQIGGTAGRSLAFGVDVSAINGSSFSGASNEWIIPNTLNIRQVNSGGTDFSNAIFSIGNGGATTIGGNLTVTGGTIGTAASTNLTLAGGSSGASLVLGQGTNGAATLTSNGSGRTTFTTPRTNTFGQLFTNSGTVAANDRVGFLFGFGGVYTNSGIAAQILDNGSTGAEDVVIYTGTNATGAGEAARFKNTGNFLIGTTTDSGNGKLQLATHTTSAGGIGFGTDTSLYREAAGTLSINHSGGDSRLYFYNAGTAQGRVESASSNFFVTAMAGSLILRSGGAVTALTLDSSQNATFAGKITANGAGSTFKGTATNDSAAAGYVGEIITSTVESGSAVSLTNATIFDVTSISLTAGDWDVDGNVGYSTSGATVTQFLQGIATASGTVGPTGSYSKNPLSLSSDSNSWFQDAPTWRVSISSTTTIYLIARSYFSAGTVGAYGFLRARRVR